MSKTINAKENGLFSELSLFTKCGIVFALLFWGSVGIGVLTSPVETSSQRYKRGKDATLDHCIERIQAKFGAKHEHKAIYMGNGESSTPYQLCRKTVDKLAEYNTDFSSELYQKNRQDR